MPPTHLSAFQPSPKRKRDTAANAPHISTGLRIVSTPRGSPEPSDVDSPGNAVADQFQGMTIAGWPIPMSPLSPTDIAPKKPKLEAHQEGRTPLEDFMHVETSPDEGEMVPDTTSNMSQTDGAREIPETPQPQAHTQTPRTFAEVMASPQPVAFASSPTDSSVKQSKQHEQMSKSRGRPPQPRSRKKSPSPPLPSLTWQDSEITGHLVDPSTDPDDDGTGINGIGFRPTPAMAYARAQKRRQQVMEWRARETKEARAKRSERRRRGVGGANMSSREGTVERDTTTKEADTSRRGVRFAI